MQDELRSSLVSTVGMSRRGFLPNVVKDVTVGSQIVGKDLAEMSDCPELLHLEMSQCILHSYFLSTCSIWPTQRLVFNIRSGADIAAHPFVT